jgi:flagellar biosynthesis anti-sigma factor FlgM
MVIMTINPIISAYGSEAVSQVRSNSGSRKGAEVESSSSFDREVKVEISAASKEMHDLRKVIDEVPEVRLQLVEELKAKIANNDYPINTKIDRIAENLITNALIA